jgi:hypothetical protein
MHSCARTCSNPSASSWTSTNPDEPGFYVALGRHAHGLFVDVLSVGDDDAVVQISGRVGRGIEVTPEVCTRPLELNAEYRYGALGLDSDGDITYDYTIPADGLVKSGLANVIRLMARISEQIGDELRMRFS